jgi:hypothetical protein
MASYTPIVITGGTPATDTDGYVRIARAAMVNAYMHAHPLATLTTLNKMVTFLAPFAGGGVIPSMNYVAQ